MEKRRGRAPKRDSRLGRDTMRALILNFIRCDSGATAIEYAFIASFVAMALIVSLTLLGTNLNSKFAIVSNGLN
jgi:pilus assembly protein Flp/PilA